MTDYIKRKDAIEEINKTLNMFGRDHTITDYDAIDCILTVPSSDVVEVVRCKDCLHGSWCEDVLWCNITDEPMAENDFCSKGDRI